MTEPFSRRDFLKIFALGAGALAYGCVPRPVREAVEPATKNAQELDPLEPTSESEINIHLGQEKSVDMHGLEWVPDTRTSYIKKGDVLQLYFSAGRSGYIAKGRDLTSLEEPKQYISPDLKQGKYGINCYRAPGAVFDDGRGNTWSVDHLEEWAGVDSGANFTARVALSQSKDGGSTWTDKGVILDGQAAEPAGKKVTGAGQPCAFLRQEDGVNFMYLYYTDWGIGPDSIHLARAPLGQIDNPDAWQKFNQGSFSSSGKGGLSTPVIIPPQGETYSALASVSFNSSLHKNIVSFETGTGFWLAESSDGLSWANNQKIAGFPEAHDKRHDGSNWFSYPTLLSFDTGNQFETSNRGVLIYSKGSYNTSPHQMKFREFNIG
jgi:hypothetical protein